METVAVLITGLFPATVADALANVPPPRQGIINRVLVGVDQRARFDGFYPERTEGVLLHVFQHDKSDLAPALDHAENRRFFLFQRAPSGCPLEPSAARGTSPDLVGPALVTGRHIHFVTFHHAAYPRF